MNESKHRGWRVAALLGVAALSGCASFSKDGGMLPVSEWVQAQAGPPVSRRTADGAEVEAGRRTAELLSRTLEVDGAVELAFLNNAGLQASFAELGISEAERVRAGRLRNPVANWARLSGSGSTEVERALVFDVLAWLSLPATRAVGQQRFEIAQYRAADAAVKLARRTREAYFRAVAAEEMLRYASRVADAAQAASELAQRMQQAGNISALARMREQVFHADARTLVLLARQERSASREALLRLLSLPPAALESLRLPERLPRLPASTATPQDAEARALERRFDLQMARRETEATARALGLTRVTRFVDGFELAYRNRSESGQPRVEGAQLAFPLPVFDFGGVEMRRAQAIYEQALYRAADLALQARSEVRETHALYLDAHALARHYQDEVLPLRQRISEENRRRHNGMLLSVFELLADAREQISAVSKQVQALRDFWIAETRLQTAMAGPVPASLPAAEAVANDVPALAPATDLLTEPEHPHHHDLHQELAP